MPIAMPIQLSSLQYRNKNSLVIVTDNDNDCDDESAVWVWLGAWLRALWA